MILQVNPLIAIGSSPPGSWLGAFASVTWLGRGYAGDPEGRHNPP